MACVFFCSLQICNHTTLFWHYRQSTALWKQYFPVPGNLWSSHYLSPMSCTLPTEQCGPSTNRDFFPVPGGTFHFDQHVCASRWEKIGIWGKEVSFSNHHGLCWVILSGASSKEWSQLKGKKKKKKQNKTKLTTSTPQGLLRYIRQHSVYGTYFSQCSALSETVTPNPGAETLAFRDSPHSVYGAGGGLVVKSCLTLATPFCGA